LTQRKSSGSDGPWVTVNDCSTPFLVFFWGELEFLLDGSSPAVFFPPFHAEYRWTRILFPPPFLTLPGWGSFLLSHPTLTDGTHSQTGCHTVLVPPPSRYLFFFFSRFFWTSVLQEGLGCSLPTPFFPSLEGVRLIYRILLVFFPPAVGEAGQNIGLISLVFPFLPTDFSPRFPAQRVISPTPPPNRPLSFFFRFSPFPFVGERDIL